jgi:hypothetical protein
MVQKPCCPASAARMVKKVIVGGSSVGIAQLDDILNEVYRMRLNDTSRVRKELLRLVKIYNYVPSSAEGEYADALIEEYRKLCRTKEAK